MRIVVFSDSHNNYFALRDIARVQTEADVFIHLGDGEREFEYLCTNFPFKELFCVRGNGDFGSLSPTERVLNLGGKKIFITHGHTYGVKRGLDDLKRRAREQEADIAMFGHTHLPYTAYEDGIHYLNPGSVSLPLRGAPSYGVVDITEAGIVISTKPEQPINTLSSSVLRLSGNVMRINLLQ